MYLHQLHLHQLHASANALAALPTRWGKECRVILAARMAVARRSERKTPLNIPVSIQRSGPLNAASLTARSSSIRPSGSIGPTFESHTFRASSCKYTAFVSAKFRQKYSPSMGVFRSF